MSKISLKHTGGNVVSLNSPTNAPGAADVAFKLPNADGSAGQFMKTDGSGNLSFGAVSAGITMVDTWVVTTSFNSTNADITANWSRQQTPATHFGGFGSAMTESSGIFTFPSNGHYYVESFISGYCNGSFRNYIGNEQKISTNSGSSYSTAVKGYTSGSGDSAQFSISIADVFDITSYNTTRWKLLFEAQGLCNIFGSTSGNTGRTGVVFIRLGDT